MVDNFKTYKVSKYDAKIDRMSKDTHTTETITQRGTKDRWGNLDYTKVVNTYKSSTTTIINNLTLVNNFNQRFKIELVNFNISSEEGNEITIYAVKKKSKSTFFALADHNRKVLYIKTSDLHTLLKRDYFWYMTVPVLLIGASIANTEYHISFTHQFFWRFMFYSAFALVFGAFIRAYYSRISLFFLRENLKKDYLDYQVAYKSSWF